MHGFYVETEAIADLRRDNSVALADRKDAVRPANAKRSEIRKILEKAALHFDELAALWEKVHGKA